MAVRQNITRHTCCLDSCQEGCVDEQLIERVRNWRHMGFSTHNGVRVRGSDADGRKQQARQMIRAPFTLEKMDYVEAGGTVIYRPKMHATLKRKGTPNRCSAAHLKIPRRPNHPVGPLSVNFLSNTVRFPISLERCRRYTLVRSPPGGGIRDGFRRAAPSRQGL